MAVLADRKAAQVQTPNFKPAALRETVVKALGDLPDG